MLKKVNLKEDLPLGSVVRLKTGHTEFIIIGKNYVNKETGKHKDYCAVPYPWGYNPHAKPMTFNKDSIIAVVLRAKDTPTGKRVQKYLRAPINKRKQCLSAIMDEILAERAKKLGKGV